MSTDMNQHTVTVSFDNEQMSLDAVVEALGGAGFTVRNYEQSP